MEKTIKDLDIYISDGNYSSKYPRSEEFVEEGIPFIRGNNMVDGDISDDEMYYIAPEKHAILLKGHVKAGDVLITTRGNIGQVAIVPERHEDSNINAQIVLLRTNPESLYNRYLLWALQSHRANEQYIALQTGTALKQLPVGKLEKLSIKVADIDEQHDIANTLDKVYEVIKERRKELLLLDDLIKARFVEMFGDPVSNSYGLPEATLLELGEFGRGVSKHRPRNDPKLLGGEYPLIQTGDVANAGLYITSYNSTYSELGLKQSKMWNKGTLCITIAANIAKTAILEFDACFPDSVVGFTANEKTNNIFVHYWFSFFQAILEAQAPESAQKNINLKMLSELKVIVPEKEKQDEFVEFIKQVDKSKVAVQKALDEAQVLFDSLMQQYFG